MKHIVVGTAGHIDHGKSTLIEVLTGVNPDRLKEEKERGITIDLGFASLRLGDRLRVGFVDVPGHERFVKNMLAGVGGIDAVLLVVAASESIMPQTREHFDICRLLSIPRGMVVITKCDLVEREIVELVQLELQDYLRGSFMEGAPVIPFSASSQGRTGSHKASPGRAGGGPAPSRPGSSLSIADRSLLQLQGFRNGRHRDAGERHDSKRG